MQKNNKISKIQRKYRIFCFFEIKVVILQLISNDSGLRTKFVKKVSLEIWVKLLSALLNGKPLISNGYHRLARQSLSALLLREHEPDGAKRFLENTSQIWWFEKFVLPLQRF